MLEPLLLGLQKPIGCTLVGIELLPIRIKKISYVQHINTKLDCIRFITETLKL
jgi:hypothetical protein